MSTPGRGVIVAVAALAVGCAAPDAAGPAAIAHVEETESTDAERWLETNAG